MMNLLKTKLSRAIAGAAILATLGAATAAWAATDFSGHWRLTEGNFAERGTEVRIHGDYDNAEGRYNWRDGRLRGRIEGDRFAGIWMQSNSAQRCRNDREGTYYWGRFEVHLSEGGNHFRGRWSYCDQSPEKGGDWVARRDN